MARKLILFCMLCLLGVSLLAAYILYDNSRIVVKEQVVEIVNLDPAFDGFTILQISDLHSVRFGRNQERLTGLIHSLAYDMIAVNGDMVDRATENPLPLMELLDNLPNKTMIFYVDGNVGPVALDRRSGAPTPFGLQLRERGCILLDRPHMILRGSARLWVSDYAFKVAEEERWIQDTERKLKSAGQAAGVAELKNDLRYLRELKKILSDIPPDDVLIGLTHYPLTPAQLDNPRPQDAPIYDLILAGHYHGGQIRVPFYRAVFIPDPSPDHFFPPEELVSGFYQGKESAQYISRGLGYSSTYLYLNFRLFNPPEITLITLKPRSQ